MSRLSQTQQSLLTFAALAAALVLLFWPGIAESQVPAFRDAYHFYYPQAVWLTDQANAGHYFPQWNNLSGLGISVPGQISSAIYYPLRILWFLPGCSVAQCYAWFIVCHLMIAAYGLRLAARRLGHTARAADLAGIAYALSCPVFFQHNNLIYLTSAAWIGFALAALVEASRQSPSASREYDSPSWSSYKTIGVYTSSCCMMFLGGDPHTLANLWILSALLLFIVFWMRRSFRATRHFASLLGVSVLLTVALTCIQWLPAYRWASHSERATNATLSADEKTELLSQLTPDHAVVFEFSQMETRSDLPYDFSVPPWYLSTTLWAQLGGHYLPRNSRTFAAIPAEGRMWQPSLYFGFIPLLLLVYPGHWPLFFRDRRLRLLFALMTFGLLASFGNYSITWFLRQCFGYPEVPDHYSSLYGLLTLLPGYDAFRFPGKWTIWFAAGACLLASSLMHQLSQENSDVDKPSTISLSHVQCFALACFSLGLLLFSLIPVLTDLGIQFAGDGWLGSPRWPDLLQTIRLSTVVPLVLGVVLLWRSRWNLGVLSILTLFEMTWVASSWVCFVDAPQSEALRAELPASARAWSSPAGGRFTAFETTTSNSNLSFATSQTRYQDRFLLAKLGEIPQVPNLGSIASVEPLLSARLKFWLNARSDKMLPKSPDVDSTLAALGVTHRLVRDPELDEASALRWQPVTGTRPFCELVVEGLPANSALSWNWTAPGRLEIELPATVSSTDSIVLVRQLDDGGWQAKGVTYDGQEVELATRFAGVLTPFTEVSSSGLARLTLERRPWW